LSKILVIKEGTGERAHHSLANTKITRVEKTQFEPKRAPVTEMRGKKEGGKEKKDNQRK